MSFRPLHIKKLVYIKGVYIGRYDFILDEKNDLSVDRINYLHDIPMLRTRRKVIQSFFEIYKRDGSLCSLYKNTRKIGNLTVMTDQDTIYCEESNELIWLVNL